MPSLFRSDSPPSPCRQEPGESVFYVFGYRVCCGDIPNWTTRVGQKWDTYDVARMSFDTPTKEYVTRSRATGKSNREIRRNLKRYVCRSIFRQLQAIMD